MFLLFAVFKEYAGFVGASQIFACRLISRQLPAVTLTPFPLYG
jgi:hypothetical protein